MHDSLLDTAFDHSLKLWLFNSSHILDKYMMSELRVQFGCLVMGL